MPTYNGPTLPTAKAAQLASSSSEETAYFANGCVREVNRVLPHRR